MSEATTRRLRLGVLVPSGNPTVEPELYRMAPARVTVHFARMDSLAGEPGGVDGMEQRTLAYLDALPAAVHGLVDVKPGVVALAHTSVSYLNGFANEPALHDRLARMAGTPAFTAARAILEALASLGVRRLAVATPYPLAIGTAGCAFWRAAGLDVVAHRQLEGVTNIYEESEERAYALGRAADVPDAEAVLISGTGLPTVGVIERLEADLGKPVVTSQAATLWYALVVLGVEDPVPGYGRLLRQQRRKERHA